MNQYLKLRPNGSPLLFLDAAGHPLMRTRFDRALRSLLKFCGLDPSRFKGHSLRIGAASQAAIDGKSDAYIRAARRW